MVADDLVNGGKLFGTKVVKMVPLVDWEKAFDESMKVASQGKILLKIDWKHQKILLSQNMGF